MPGTLVLLRHGQSRANADDTFAGRLDVPLIDVGIAQSQRAADLLGEHGLEPDLVLTSPLSRALATAQLLISRRGLAQRPIVRDELAERGYGALEGRRRSDVIAEFGVEQVARWRRGWNVVAPTGPDGGVAESLQDVSDRVLPLLHAEIEPAVLAGRCVLVVAHGNVLRVLTRALRGLDEQATAAVQIPVGVPLVHGCGPLGIDTSAYFLDSAAAAAGIDDEVRRGT